LRDMIVSLRLRPGERIQELEVAQVLGVSPETVKWHLKNVYGKLGVSGRDEAVARVRLVNLDTGNLVYSSYPSEFNGRTPADLGELGGSGSRALAIDEQWVRRMVRPLFEKQR